MNIAKDNEPFFPAYNFDIQQELKEGFMEIWESPLTYFKIEREELLSNCEKAINDFLEKFSVAKKKETVQEVTPDGFLKFNLELEMGYKIPPIEMRSKIRQVFKEVFLKLCPPISNRLQ